MRPWTLFLCVALCACTGAVDSPAEAAREPTAGPEHDAGLPGADTDPSTGLSGAVTASLEQVRSRCAETRVPRRSLRRLTRAELAATLRDLFPVLGDGFETQLGPDPLSALRFTNDANTLVVSSQVAGELLRTARDVAARVSEPASLRTLLPCAADAPGPDCADTFIDAFGPRLYRRPLSIEERTELRDHHAAISARAGFAAALEWTLVAMLSSPALLYRAELGDEQGELDGYELASQLAYTFGGTTPSPALLARAAGGELASADVRLEVARELSTQTGGKEVLRRFFREWLGYEQVLGTTRDLVANFPALQVELVAETERFLAEVVELRGGGVKELLTSPFTFSSLNLTLFYGFGSYGSELTEVERPAGRGLGVLAQGSILAAHAHGSHTSPTLRGLLVYTRLLCNTPPPPPPVVPALEATGPTQTTRERYEQAHAQAECQTCHHLFDPIGFTFEHFDESGRHRETEHGFALDTHGSVGLPGGATRDVAGFEELIAVLAEEPAVIDCVSGLLTSYAFGGAGGEVCLAEEARTELQSARIGLRDFHLELARAPSFGRRQ